MSGPRAVQELLAIWTSRATVDEERAIRVLCACITNTLEEARNQTSPLDRRCLALVITKLEEAEHWALQALRIIVDRTERARDQGGS